MAEFAHHHHTHWEVNGRYTAIALVVLAVIAYFAFVDSAELTSKAIAYLMGSFLALNGLISLTVSHRSFVRGQWIAITIIMAIFLGGWALGLAATNLSDAFVSGLRALSPTH